MVFKKPTAGRDDRPNKSSRRPDNGESAPKRGASAGKPYGSRTPADKRDFNPSGRKPFNKSFSGDKPADGDKPRRSFGPPSGDRKPFAPKSKPYGTRDSGSTEGRPARKGYGDAAFGDKKPFGPKKPYVSGPTHTDKPKRSFGGDRTGDDRPKRNFSDRPNDDRPKCSFDGERTGDENRPFKGAGGTGYTNSTGKKDFRSTTSGYKKRDDSRSEGDAPTRTMRGRKNPAPKKDDGLIRLNRYIANAGICSRRKADELIAAGVVSVNGEVINELGHKVDPHKDIVRYNGEALKREKMVYVLLNKPKDYITTTDDPQERRTVMHLVEKASRERIYPVGRLDRNTTGLLLMTNDGDLADKLSHPRNNIVKLYNVELNKSLTQGDLNKIGFGLELEDGFIKPDSISYVTGGTKREVGIQIHSGKNRIVRRIFESLGYEVVKLDRSVYANLTKKDLPRGRWRFLEEKELIQLKHLI